jgi:hypothetical protein
MRKLLVQLWTDEGDDRLRALVAKGPSAVRAGVALTSSKTCCARKLLSVPMQPRSKMKLPKIHGGHTAVHRGFTKNDQ